MHACPRFEQADLSRRTDMVVHSSQLRQDLESHVRARTGRRLRNLDIQLFPERIILRGQAASFHVKQLAQQGVLDLLPDVRLENAIEVQKPGRN
jgi:hypothetical protein